ncbi:MAG: RNA polymerase sigma factor [Planctomycetes bacterium]|nr:RNA polymerase sigma factor [Planctomycetota bacterium]
MSLDETTRSLVVAAQAGDAEARESLFVRFLPRVARMVAARLGVRRDDLPAEAEDLAQEAVLKALSALGDFEVRGQGAFAAWLATIVENCVRSHWRAQGRQGQRRFWQRYGDLDLTESFFATSGGSPSHSVASAEQNLRVERALLDLPHLYRQVLSLRFFAGMSHTELAGEIGRTEANSRKLTQRALECLRTHLARQNGS